MPTSALYISVHHFYFLQYGVTDVALVLCLTHKELSNPQRVSSKESKNVKRTHEQCLKVCMCSEGEGLYQPRRHRPLTGPYAVPKRFSVVAQFYIEML